jgi:hypothetical protein
MLFLYKTSDEDFATLAVKTLREHGIEVHMKSIPAMTGSGLPGFAEYDLYVCNDGDFDQAKRLLISIGAVDPAPVALPSKRATLWIIVASLAAVAIVLLLLS